MGGDLLACQSQAGVLVRMSACVPDTELLSLVEMSTQTSFLMTVKVDGVALDGTTMFIHNKVHNRTRTLTCAEVSAFHGPWLLSRPHHHRRAFLSKKPHTSEGMGKPSTFIYRFPYKCLLTHTHLYTHAQTHTRTQTHSHAHTCPEDVWHLRLLFVALAAWCLWVTEAGPPAAQEGPPLLGSFRIWALGGSQASGKSSLWVSSSPVQCVAVGWGPGGPQRGRSFTLGLSEGQTRPL